MVRCSSVFCAVAVFVMGMASPAFAELITDVSASASSINAASQSPLFVVDGAGLTDTNHSKGHLDSTMWMTGPAVGLIDQEYLTIDLKKNYLLDSVNTLKVWNHNDKTSRGMRIASFWYLADDGGAVLTGTTQPAGAFTQVTGATTNATANTFDVANGSDSATNYNTVSFNQPVTARYLRIKVEGGAGVGNYGDAAFVGLSEVQAFGVVP